MKSPVTGLRIRYRANADSAWMYRTFFPGAVIDLDDITHGETYELQAQNTGVNGLNSGWTTITEAVSATARTGAMALPPVTVGNIGSLWTGTTITWSATDTLATINVSAGTLQVGGQQVAYAASSVQVVGVADEVRDVFLYYDDARFQGGTRTLGATSDEIASMSASGRIAIGGVKVTFDVAGGGGGTGGGGDAGGGGGGACPWVDAWVIAQHGVIRAGDVVVGDLLLLADPETLAETWGEVTHSQRKSVPGVRLSAGPAVLSCSTTAPIPTEVGYLDAPDTLGRAVPVKDAGNCSVVDVADLGLIDVQHITVGDRCFWVGDDSLNFLLHHNAKVIF